MKCIKNKWQALFIVGLMSMVASCVDPIKFGDSFLEKAPGGDVTEDTVFNSAEYTRQYLTSIYRMQYYGIPDLYLDSNKFPYTPHSYWKGHLELITDQYHNIWSSCEYYKRWYTGAFSASDGYGKNKREFISSNIWQIVRAGWKLIDHIDRVPGLGDTEKKEMVAQAKCLMADAYYDLFRHYGGMPLVKQAFKGTEDSYEVSRMSVEETVNFMLQLLDEAIPNLPWAYNISNSESYDNAENDMGHWTKAGAKALKCKILLFAASPLFNNAQPYAGGTSEAEQQKLVWYGSYKPELWTQCANACEDFFNDVKQLGYYSLEKSSSANPTAGEYRMAYRRSYLMRDSKEILHSTRTVSTGYSGNYFVTIGADRMGHPTAEYMKKFAWADGRAFDWEETEAEGKLDEMFVRFTNPTATYKADNVVLTRDPRLYETMNVNGMPFYCSESGQLSGDPWEVWVRGTDAGTAQTTNSGSWAMGFLNNKFIGDFKNRSTIKIPQHWPALRLSDLYLTYAEALLQAKNDFTGAIKLIDEVRARVGLKGLVVSNPGKNLTTDKQALLDAIMNERSCELGMEDSRLFDMIRYKMTSEFEKTLHYLRIYRLDDQGNVLERQWSGADKTANVPFPTKFKYELVPVSTGKRIWWTDGFAPKWFLSPITQTEIEKGYLVQNPGW